MIKNIIIIVVVVLILIGLIIWLTSGTKTEDGVPVPAPVTDPKKPDKETPKASAALRESKERRSED